MTNYSIEMKKVRKNFGKKRVLRDLNLTVSSGETVMIFGKNGSGKTTLIKILSTMMKMEAGEVSICGLNSETRGTAVRRMMGVVTHETMLYEHLTAYENLKFYAKMFGLNKIIPVNSEYNFLGLRKNFLIFSSIVIIISIILLSFKGLNLGIDFKGGTLIEISTKNSSISELRSILSPKFNDVSLQEFGNKNTIIIRLQNKDNQGQLVLERSQAIGQPRCAIPRPGLHLPAARLAAESLQPRIQPGPVQQAHLVARSTRSSP